MNRVHTINLGGFPFTIDDDAFGKLERYLKQIENHFRSSEGFEEIYGDIERRMAELLEERLKARQIVSLKDVEYAIGLLGTPRDFGATDEAEETFQSGPERQYKTGKRLFRDPDDKMVGGVCGGLAAYFGIADVVWVRIAFALAALGGGFGVLLYFLFWAIVPEAKTPGDFLAMRGVPINVKNIARIVEEQIEQISEQLSGLGEEFKAKARRKKARHKHRYWGDEE